MSGLADLERRGLIARISYSRKRVRDFIGIASRDLEVARSLVDESADWSHSIAYNSMLQSSRALMFSRGYRPTGQASHLAVIMFLRNSFAKELGPLVTELDRVRKKRHVSVYDTAGSVSQLEARHALEAADELLKKVKSLLPAR